MAVSQSEIIDRLSAYLKKRFLASGVEIQPANKFADIGIDSMSVVELVMFIEEEFGIVIPADQLTTDNLASLSSLANCAIQNQKD